MKIEVLPREQIEQMNRFLTKYSLEVVGASFTETGSLNIAFSKKKHARTEERVTVEEFAKFCKEEMKLDVKKFMINGCYEIKL